jgi:UDP-N-acetylglucosamine 4,6-dehydratase
MNWKDSVVLVTEGTGSFGKRFAQKLLREHCPRKLIIFSRDELKQYEIQKHCHGPNVRYFIGDIRDRDRLMRALV